MSGLKTYIQSLVVEKIPDAFALRKTELPSRIPTGIWSLDRLIQGFQRGDMTEIYGHGSSGRTTIAVSFIAEVTRRQEVCALVDVSDAADPESLFMAGVDLNRLLWIRCGSPPIAFSASIPTDFLSCYCKQNRRMSKFSAKREPSFSSGQHPRHEVRGLSHAIAALMGSSPAPPFTTVRGEEKYEHRNATSPPLYKGGLRGGRRMIGSIADSVAVYPPQVPPCTRGDDQTFSADRISSHFQGARRTGEGSGVIVEKRDDPQNRLRATSTSKSMWARLEQALRVTDLLLNNGGFGAVVLDLGDVPVENSRRIPLTSWFRFRRSVENTPTVLVLLSNEPCGGTCASLVLHCECCQARWHSAGNDKTGSQVWTLEGLDLLVDVTRCRSRSQTVTNGTYSFLGSSAHWKTRMSWAR